VVFHHSFWYCFLFVVAVACLTLLAVDLEASFFAKYLDIRIYLTSKFDANTVKNIMLSDVKVHCSRSLVSLTSKLS